MSETPQEVGQGLIDAAERPLKAVHSMMDSIDNLHMPSFSKPQPVVAARKTSAAKEPSYEDHQAARKARVARKGYAHK
jgi:hypothetical protein